MASGRLARRRRAQNRTAECAAPDHPAPHRLQRNIFAERHQMHLVVTLAGCAAEADDAVVVGAIAASRSAARSADRRRFFCRWPSARRDSRRAARIRTTAARFPATRSVARARRPPCARSCPAWRGSSRAAISCPAGYCPAAARPMWARRRVWSRRCRARPGRRLPAPESPPMAQTRCAARPRVVSAPRQQRRDQRQQNDTPYTPSSGA